MNSIPQHTSPVSEIGGSYSSENSSASNDIATLLQGKYRIIKELGKGSQGAVFLAEDVRTHSKVAIKQLRIQSVKDWKAYDLFHREADTLQRLHIDGVAKFYAVREFLNIPEPCALLIQEYIDGDPLQNFITNGHRFSMNQIGDLLLQLLNIVEKLHHSNPPVIHRDIKPSNILMRYIDGGEYPKVHLIDFGAVANPQVKSGGSTVVGTYGYMAPEQLMGRATAASDIYSIAIVAVYLLSGTPPEQLDVQDFVVLIDPHLEHLPHQITGVLRKMLAPNIHDRLTDFNTIRQFFTALKDQRYELIPKVADEKNVLKAYKLKNVESYLQPGNIDIWQSLSDTVPRSVPMGMMCSIVSGIMREIRFDGCVRHKRKKTRTLWFYLALALLAVGGDVACFVLLLFSSPDIFGVMCFLIFVFTIISLILCCVIFASLKCYCDSIRDWLSFIRSARKSMATVIRIRYAGQTDDLKPAFYLKAFHPAWIITYRFNPPDDRSSNDLIRTVTTHRKPKELKVGSLIPILYRIKKDSKGEHVLSVPFPVPFDELSGVAIDGRGRKFAKLIDDGEMKNGN